MTQVLIDRATLEQAIYELEKFNFDKLLVMTKLREALANAEPIARMQPVTKTRVGNYLNKHLMGDLTAYRHGFKDGVKWREQQ